MDENNLIYKIKSYLFNNPNSLAKDIAASLNIPKKEINQYLFSELNQQNSGGFYFVQNEHFQWSLSSQSRQSSSLSAIIEEKELETQMDIPNDDKSINTVPIPDFMTGDVATGLARLRNRLLDLSNRNKLLNFKYYIRSTLRVVDELPDQLFESLLKGTTFVFDPVPSPKNYNDKFTFFQQNPGQLDHPDQLEEFTDNKNTPMPKVDAYARWKKINTDYELPNENDINSDRRHEDTKIQTLLYPNDLEATGSRLASLSRTAIEETGSNMLFLSFGFLEWSEGDNIGKTFLAPLLLLPVSIEKQKKSRDGRYKFEISYSGETLQANLSLQEKLKGFDLDLPDIIPEKETPENYFKAVQKVIDNKSGWSIKRHVSLGILQFGRQLLYLDLDPEKWPKNNNITKNDLVSNFFLGGEETAQYRLEDYQIDEKGDFADLPLITEADSSQHSAIIDVVKGKSLVIEGPPGTGKSQTITNMIACAINEGKKVLFVAEKLAALEVVRRRLDQVGLGDFTLELHSNKTRKKAMLNDIETRLKKQGQYQAPSKLKIALNELHKKRDCLKKHGSFMHANLTGLDLSPYTLLHKAARYEKEIITVCPEIEEIVNNRDELFSIDQYTERLDLLKTMMRSFKVIIDTSGSLKQSPWFGVNKEDIRARDGNKLIKDLKDCIFNLKACEALLEKLFIDTKIKLENSSATYHKIIGLKDGLSLLPNVNNWHAIQYLHEVKNRNSLRVFINKINEYNIYENKFKEHFTGSNYPCCEQEIAIRLVKDFAISQMLSTTPLTNIKAAIKSSKNIIDDINSTQSEWLNVLSYIIGIDQRLSIDNIKLANTAVQLCASSPLDNLKYRSVIFDENIDALLIHIGTKQSDLISRKKLIDDGFSNFEKINDITLQSAATILDYKTIFKIFNPQWWNARSLFLKLCSNVQPQGNRSRSEWLRFIADFKRDKIIYEKEPRYNEQFGKFFKGMDTDINGFISLHNWFKEVQEKLGFGFNAKGRVGNQILALKKDRIKSLSKLQKQGLCEKGDNIFESISWLENNFKIKFNKDISFPEQVSSNLKNLKKLSSDLMKLPLPLLNRDLTITEFNSAFQYGLRARKLHSEIDQKCLVKEIIGKKFDSVLTNISAIEEVITFANIMDEAITQPEVRDAIYNSSSIKIIEDLLSWHEKANSSFENLLGIFDKLINEYELDVTVWFGTANDSKDFNYFNSKASVALDKPTLLSDWIAYVQNRDNVSNKGIPDLVELIEEEKLPPNYIEGALAYLTYFPHADELAKSDPYILKTNGYILDQTSLTYTELDKEILNFHKQCIAAVLDRNQIPLGRSTGRIKDLTELALIRHEITKTTRHLPIRQLIKRSGKALQALKPCWMMGPLSVAQYLAPGEIEFDLVIMDEASQMKPEDALGSIARAKQVIIVGDPKQLPPSGFFERNYAIDLDDESLVGLEESESILDAAGTVFGLRRLRWHYRSQSEDLIAFSNKYFYDNDLVVFPSPTSRKAISYEFVPDAFCQKGRNNKEARLVAQRVIDFMETGTSNSLGVVAMNTSQQGLIEDEFLKLLKSSPKAENYYEKRAGGSEPFFIKNLENVQGDERDVIIISFTYGPDPITKKVKNYFGPINLNTGWRRLNVLYTRAKKNIIVISSMRAEHITLTANAQLGPKVLQKFLAYAENGSLVIGGRNGKKPESDFEIVVANAMKKKGYDCVAQLGAAGHFLDIAIIHPDEKDSYIMGLECDGPNYHKANSVRDRDRLRPLVLKRLGWNLKRIWSIDWFEDSDRQIEKLCTEIEELRKRDKNRKIKKEARDEEKNIKWVASIPRARTPAPSREQEIISPRAPAQERYLDLDKTVEQNAITTIDKLPSDVEHNDEAEKRVLDTYQGYISIEEARTMLVNLRENKIHLKYPSSDRAKGFLRNEMIDMLLKKLPENAKEFLSCIPTLLRGDNLDGQQYEEYRADVFKILAEVEE